jgi:hypothetical protein
VSAELTQPAGTGASAPAPKRAGVVGASGILGGELLRILLGHPRIELEYVSAQTKAGRSATELNPHLKDAGVGEFEAFDARVAAKRCDVVFLATPPETAGRAVPELLEAGAELVVDLSPAYRIRDPELHRQWYPEVERDQEIAEAAAYGLPELSRGGAAIGREAIRDASVIAMPGCFDGDPARRASAARARGRGLRLDRDRRQVRLDGLRRSAARVRRAHLAIERRRAIRAARTPPCRRGRAGAGRGRRGWVRDHAPRRVR